MLAVAFPNGTRALVGVLAAAIAAGAAIPVLLGDAGASAASDRLAARLTRLDPAARIGGNTQVATVARARLSGVPGRVNFMIGLAPRQLIVGGDGHDQLGAHRAAGARIHGAGGADLIHGGRGRQRIHGGHGHDLIRGGHGHDRIQGGHGHDRIHGGPGRDRLEGGPGRDRLVDRQGATVVVTGSGRNQVDVADGGRDRVLCAAGSANRIVVDRSDRLDGYCFSEASTVRYRRLSSAARGADAPVARTAQTVSGDGSSANPYTAACSDPQSTICTVNAFPARSLTGVWKNEYVPAYQCPSSHALLHNHKYAPAGTSLIHGVEVAGLGKIGVSITGFKTTTLTSGTYEIGSDTGWPNSSATSWDFGTNSYRVQLHCTNNTAYAFKL
jgi:RTX calcium-binding nonapeptide repeat (4 copies)